MKLISRAYANSRMTVLTLAFAVTISTLLLVACSHSSRKVAADSAPASVKPIRSEYAVGEITALCKTSMDRTVARLDDMVAAAKGSTGPLAFDKSVGAFEEITADLTDDTTLLTFMKYVSTDKARRKEGSDCEEAVGQIGVDISSRKDIYQVVKRSIATGEDQKRLLSETMRGFKQSGLELPDDQLAKLKGIKKQISTNQNIFSTNLNEDKTSVAFTAGELEGCTADFIARHKQDDKGKYIVFANEADYPALEENAKNPETRKALAIAYNNRALPNTALLETTVLLREKAAQLLGYKSWADVQIDGRMAVNSKNVFALLNTLKTKLAKADRRDLAKLLAAKRKLEDPNAKAIEAWDISYFANQLKKSEYKVDDEIVRTYFPKDTVVAGLFQIYSTLLGVNFEEVLNAEVWSPDVKLFAIKNKKDGALIGYFYTDFFPREGKYNHAASFPLISGRVLQDGKYSFPVAAIVSNLTPGSIDKPALLSHDDVETIFHEFGHIMHQTLTKAPYASLSGSSVAQDFVEAPSQMLQNWVWEAQTLNLMSGNYKEPSQKLPADLLKKLIAARDFNQGYTYTRQLMLALTDMQMHTAPGAVDTMKLYNDNYKSLIGVTPITGGHFIGTFGHLMGGYDAGYYGYLWSEVYAADMFTVFKAGGLLSPEIGGRYRRTILEEGRMKDPNLLLTEFLGRKSNSKAFYKKLHIK